jgi:hypothetical protein
MTLKRVAASVGALVLIAAAMLLFLNQGSSSHVSAGKPGQQSKSEQQRHALAGVSAYLAVKRGAGAKSPGDRKVAREQHKTGLRIGAATGLWRKYIYAATFGTSPKKRSIGLQLKTAKTAKHKLTLAEGSAKSLNLTAVAAAARAASHGLGPIIDTLSNGDGVSRAQAERQNALMDAAVAKARAAGLSATPYAPI